MFTNLAEALEMAAVALIEDFPSFTDKHEAIRHFRREISTTEVVNWYDTLAQDSLYLAYIWISSVPESEIRKAWPNYSD